MYGPVEKYRVLEERLGAIEGHDAYDLKAFNMWLVTNVVILTKFKVPDFEKCKGLSCPKNHLRMFCRKMAAYSCNDKLLIHCFQNNLSGATLD